MISNFLKSLIVILILIFTQSFVLGQSIEMADAMRSEGKIYVVVAVIMLILAGLLFYLYITDRKISKIEEELKNKK